MATSSDSAVLGAANAHLTFIPVDVTEVGVEVVGTFTATITLQVRIGTEWQDAPCQTLAGAAVTNVLTAAGSVRINVSGFNAVRALMTPYTSGSAVVTITGTEGGGLPGGGGGSGGGGSTVDTELPAAVALAAGMANPTAPAVGAFGMVFNGTTWDRVREPTSDAATAVGLVASGNMVWNGTTWDRWGGTTAGGFVQGPVATGSAGVSRPVIIGADGGSNTVRTINGLSLSSDAVATGNIGLITQAANLAFNGTSWERCRTASADALAATGLLAAGNMVWNGTTWDRAKGNTTAPFAQGPLAAGVAASGANPFVIGLSTNSGGNVIAAIAAVANADTLTATNNGILATSRQFSYNATTWDGHRNNVEATLLASAARTTIQASADITTYNLRGITLVLDVTAIVDTPSLVVTIDGKDSASGKYVNLLTGAAVVAVSTNRYRIYPGLTAAANLDVNAALSRLIRITVTPADTDSATYSAGYVLHV